MDTVRENENFNLFVKNARNLKFIEIGIGDGAEPLSAEDISGVSQGGNLKVKISVIRITNAQTRKTPEVICSRVLKTVTARRMKNLQFEI